MLSDANYILGAGADRRVALGAFVEILLAISGIATAVVVFPILWRQSEAIALGDVASRIVASALILVGLISLLSVITLREDLAGAGADTNALSIVGQALVALHDGTFLLGPQFCAGFGNGLLLGFLMYKVRPRATRDGPPGPHRQSLGLRWRIPVARSNHPAAGQAA